MRVLLVFLLMVFLQQVDVFAQSYKTKYLSEGYDFVWSDEFNENGAVNSKNWWFEQGYTLNNVEGWYQNNNAWCKDGYLIIEGRKEENVRVNPNYNASSDSPRDHIKDIRYTSSALVSKNRHHWLYGRFEMRAKIDASVGLWPAFWTLGVVDKPWPFNGEIDIMESYKGLVLANFASGSSKVKGGKWVAKSKEIKKMGGKAWLQKFHVWRLDWTEEYMAIYIDNVLINKVLVSEMVNDDGSGFNPFQHPHYLALNLALGGVNAGSVKDTVLPKRFIVDYIRVYQK